VVWYRNFSSFVERYTIFGGAFNKCGVVLDITDRKIPLEECIKCIEDRASDRCLNNTEVIIKDKDKVIKILRVKK